MVNYRYIIIKYLSRIIEFVPALSNDFIRLPIDLFIDAINAVFLKKNIVIAFGFSNFSDSNKYSISTDPQVLLIISTYCTNNAKKRIQENLPNSENSEVLVQFIVLKAHEEIAHSP